MSSGLSPLHLAVLRGQKDLTRMLLEAGADINAMVTPKIHNVTTADGYRLCVLLTFPLVLFFFFFVLSDQDVKSGQSPLMHAVESNDVDMVHFLIGVMRVFGLGGRRGEKRCDSARSDRSVFFFLAHKLLFSFFSSPQTRASDDSS